MSGAKVEVVLPASEPAELYRPRGNPDGIDALAAIVLEAAGRFDEYSDESLEFKERKGWTGESGDRYTRKAQAVSVRAGRMRNTLKRTGRVLIAGADRLRSYKRDYQEHVERKRSLDDQVAQLRAEVLALKSVNADQLAQLQARADHLGRKYQELVEDDRRLARLATQNEELLADTLAASTDRDDVTSGSGGRPEVAYDAMRKPGSPLGGKSTPEQVAAWWKGLTGEERRGVIASYAPTIAGAEGLPDDVRERADRVRDEEVMIRLRNKAEDGTITPEEQQRLARLEREAEREGAGRR